MGAGSLPRFCSKLADRALSVLAKEAGTGSRFGSGRLRSGLGDGFGFRAFDSLCLFLGFGFPARLFLRLLTGFLYLGSH